MSRMKSKLKNVYKGFFVHFMRQIFHNIFREMKVQTER